MAAYVKVTYSVSSTTSPTYVARYEWMDELVDDWIDHVTIGSSGGTVITIEPWAPEGTDIWYYAYTFPTTGNQDLYFFSKTNEIPDYAFIDIDNGAYPGHILSIDCSQSNNDITGIGKATFSNNMGMQSAYLSDNITRIGRNAFEQDSAMTVCNIPQSLSAIPSGMFSMCYSLQHIRIPDNIQSIDTSAFAYCFGLEDVYLGSGLTFFNTFAFGGCSALTSITATSRNVPITYYTNTFQGVHTGGTLYYPAGYESEYGPESGMLSTEEYLLGYYDWSGVTTGAPYVYISGATTFIVNFKSGTSYVYIGAENCVLERSTPTFTQTGDIVNRIGTLGIADDKYYVTVQRGINSGSTSRNSLVTFNVKDTSGNTYPLQISLTQGTGTTVYVDPMRNIGSSDAGVVEFNAYAVNCTLTGAGLVLTNSSVTGDWSSGPAYVEHVKVSDNHMIVRVAYPQNTGSSRSSRFVYKALTNYGDQGFFNLVLVQSAYTPSPGEVSATSITLNVDNSITGSGIATTTVNPGDASANLRYTSSNSTIATVDQNGRITVVRNGQVTICVKDLITELQDCKTIRVTKGSTPGGDDDDLIYVYTGITVNDNEGHRYNITAEPGYKYGCLGKTYKTVSACEARYSLYYINAYGGVDVLPCKGKSSMKKDNITRYNYSRTFRNNTLEFENTNYLSEIKTTWELHTGYMVDTQSEKMHHLVESTCVFLYDALEQTYTPVVMTDKTLEYKTFHNQGRTFYNYTINIEESQSRERR